jgi:hypothetical protein
MLNTLHTFKSEVKINKDIILNDLQIECYDKVITRITQIEPIINYFGKIEYVNSFKIKPIDHVLKTCFEIIKKTIKYEYVLIHGDCQFSNTLFDNINNNLYIIDPRGYFGNTKLFGLQEYDYAKVLYALSGYDNFNNDSEYFIKKLEKNSITIDIKNYEHLYSRLNHCIFNECTIAFLIIIWISLAQYCENNALKCVSSYYYGLYLFSRYIETD